MSAADRDVRYQAALLAPGRWSGRKAQEREARFNDIALAQLRQRLGFPSAAAELLAAEQIQWIRIQLLALPTWFAVEHEGEIYAFVCSVRDSLAPRARADYARRIAYVTRRTSKEWAGLALALAQVIAPEAISADVVLRATRADARWVAPQIAVSARWAAHVATDEEVRAEARAQYERADFRKATHAHSCAVRGVPRGHESATATTAKSFRDGPHADKYRASYKYPVTVSEHTICASRAVLGEAVRALNASAPAGVLYLRADLRVRQGAGTGLVVERLGVRGGWAR